MKDKILKWWNRKWGVWEKYENIYSISRFGYKEELIYIKLKRTSDDGLIEFKIIKH
jgi:hypothetical protein